MIINLDNENTTNLDNESNVLSIMVRQASGGINYYNGKREERGIYIYFCKEKYVKQNGYVTREYMPFDDCNFKILAETNKRKNQKRLDIYEKFIFDNKDKLLELWLERDIPKLRKLIGEVNEQSIIA